MKKYLILLLLLTYSYNTEAQQSVTINGPTYVEVGVPYNYTFTFNPVYPIRSSDGVRANQVIITEWIVNTGTNGGGTTTETNGYIGYSNNNTNYYYDGTYNNANPITIPIMWGDATFLRSDYVTVKVSGIYRNSNLGSDIGYFNFVTNDLTINTVNRITTPLISGPSLIGSCGDQTTSTYTISNQTYADQRTWSVDGGAQIMGSTIGQSVTVIPPPTPLSGNYTVNCTVRSSSGIPTYNKTNSKSVTRAPIVSSAAISGPTGICTGTANYTISNITSGQTVTWNLTGNGTLSNPSNAGTAVNIAGNGLLQLNATIRNACNQTTIKTYTIFNGLPTFSSNASIQGVTTNMCTTSGPTIFNLNNVTAGQSVVWSLSDNSIASLTSNGAQATLTPSGNESGQQTLTATITNSCGQTATKKVSFYIGKPTFNKFTYGCANRSLCITSDANYAFTSPTTLNTKNRVIASFFGLTSSEAASSYNWQWREAPGNNLLYINNSSPRNFLDLCPIAAGTTVLQVRAKNNSCLDFSEWVDLPITIVQLPSLGSFRLSQSSGVVSLREDAANTLGNTATTQYNWASNNIWLRNTQDGIQEHQNPVYNENVPNYVYARIKNIGCGTTPSSSLKTYWAKASTSLNWPNTWNGTTYNGGEAKLGDAIGTISIPELQPEQETIVSMPFMIPNPDKYMNIVNEPWRFGLLARVTSESDEATANETDDLMQNINNNENIALKNVTIVDFGNDNPDEQTIGGVIAVGNTFNTPKSFYLELVKEDLETGKPIYDEAEVSLKLDETLYQAWVRGGKTAERIENTLDDKIILVKDNNVFLKDLELNSNETGTLYIKFNFLTKEITDKARYVYHVIQRETGTDKIIGGETYVIKKQQRPLFTAEAGGTKYVDKNEPITISAAQLNEPAIYNWYDSDGNLVSTGKDLSIATQIAQKFKLEVITTDGFKDYSEVEVRLKPNALKIISPNPAGSNVNITYKLNEVSSAYLMILGGYGTTGTSNNYILDLNSEETNIDLSNYSSGFFTVALICDGQIVDAKTLVKQ
jgi:hypothetical protein